MNTEKKCQKCLQVLDIDDFAKNKRKKDGRHCWCKSCQKIYKDMHYKTNKGVYKARTKKRKVCLKSWILDLKSTLSCTHCGQAHPAILDFHHTDPTKKEFSINNGIVSKLSKKRILEEIGKCIPLCSNCHRILHYNERHEIKEKR
jgi:hypothetical protein